MRDPGVPDPDTWSRKWILGASIALVVGGLLPQPDVEAFLLGDETPGYLWPWELATRGWMSWTAVWSHVATAAVGLVSLLARGAWRGGILVLGSIAVVIAGAAFLEPDRILTIVAGIGGRFDRGSLTPWIAALGLIGIVVGNRIRRRSPSDRLATRITGVGGVMGLLTMFLFCRPIEDGAGRRGLESEAGPALGFLFEADQWKYAWPMLLLGISAIAFAGMGVRAFRTTDVARRARWTSRLARGLLIAHPIALFGVIALTNRWLETSAQAVIAIRRASLFDGTIVLMATGLALWLETGMTRRAAKADESA